MGREMKVAVVFQWRLSRGDGDGDDGDKGDGMSDDDMISIVGALMSMGRVSETRLRRRRAKQSGGIDIEFKTVKEYSVKVNKIKVIMNESA
ncbi:hypothetical protein Tco_0660236 [Tanacetum coccineum]